MTKNKLLLCLGDFPFPARKNGYSIRCFPIIEHFSQQFDIDLFVKTGFPVTENDLQEAYRYCKKVTIYQRRKKSVSVIHKLLKRSASLIPGNTPFDFVYYDQSDMDEVFKANYSSNHYDLAVCASLPLSHLVRKYANYDRLSVDVIDSPYALKLRVAHTLLQKYEAWLVKIWERRSIDAVDCASYISPLDRKLGCGDQVSHEKVNVIPNGVFLNDATDEAINFGGPTIGYLGHMGYPPNIMAAKRLYSIFKNAQQNLPNLRLVIIGRDPTSEILVLSQDPTVTVTGTVENIWPYVNGIDVFVFPMETGSGQQNKLLEAMAVKKPVIATDLGNSGVLAVHGKSVLIANSDEEICADINLLMTDPSKRNALGHEGYKFVMQTYSWDSIFQKLSRTLFSIKQ